jgi:hypothetical protein
MRRPSTDQEKLFRIAAACQEAIQAQRQREARQAYGLDDYIEGRVVGAANQARKLLRVFSGSLNEEPPARTGPWKPAGR